MPASSGFAPLPDDFEPTPEAVAEAVGRAFADTPRLDGAVCFAGLGEPLLRLRAAGLSGASVALASADPDQYAALMEREPPWDLLVACSLCLYLVALACNFNKLIICSFNILIICSL